MFLGRTSLNASITVGVFLLATRIADEISAAVCIACEVVLLTDSRVTQGLIHDEIVEQRGVAMSAPLSIDSQSNVLQCLLRRCLRTVQAQRW
jgi:hypothetical protein